MVPVPTYKRITRRLVEELSSELLGGRSLILIGPRYVGKRHVLHQVRDKLEAARVAPIVQVKFLSESLLSSEEQVRELFDAAIRNAFLSSGNPVLGPAEPFEDTLVGPLDRLITATRKRGEVSQRKPIFLIVSNVDSLAHHLALGFLEKVKQRIEDGKVIGLLTAEDDVQGLVPRGFNCALPYVLQPYAQDEFGFYLAHYADKMNITFESPVEAASELWRLTGGNRYTMKMVLWALVEARARSVLSASSVKTSDIPQSLNLIGIPTVYGNHVFRHGTEIVERSPESWQPLQELISTKTVPIGLHDSAPTTLEVSGFAIRETSKSPFYLKFASPLHETFVRQYYDDRRFGNLYAAVGDWDKAFDFYAKVPPQERIRPLGLHDWRDAETSISSLCSRFFSDSEKYETSGDRIEAMKEVFASGAKYLLGFNEISFWRRDPWRTDGGWQMISPQTFAPSTEDCNRIKTSLSTAFERGMPFQFDAPWDQFSRLAFLPALRADQRLAVVISDFQRRIVVSSARKKAADKVLKHFGEGYAYANAYDGLQIRLKVREQHVEIMKSIFNALGSDVQNVRQVLEMAARGLRELQYKRVLFSLVDPERRRIQGVLDDNSSDPKVDLSSYIDFPLRDEGNLHTLVIRECKAYQIPDASRDGRVDPKLTEAGNLQSFAVVPIIDTSENAIGTIHVEHSYGLMPSDTEVTDLISFGRQLAIAIEQSERVTMLQSSLDKIPEPIVIVDGTERRRYANRPAAELLGIPEGWVRPTADQKRFGEEVGGIGAELLHQSLAKGNRLLSHFKGLGTNADYRGAALTDIIEDWREKTAAGGLLHVQDLNYLHRVFLAARMIGEAQDTASAFGRMLTMAQELLGSNKWGRLYLADDPENPERLISKLSFGYEPDDEKRFSEGGIVLERNTPGGIDWLAFERRKPVVFCWNDKLQPGDIFVTPFGLQADNAPNPPQPPEIQKHPGDFWIDFPLMTQDKILGKLCFQCDENLRPEDYELLGLLCEVVVGLFDAFVVRARLLSDREEVITASTARQTVENFVHNLHTRFGNLSFVATKYWLLCEKYPHLADLRKETEHFVHIVDETLKASKRAKDMLGPLRPQWMDFDLGQHLRQTLDRALPADSWTVEDSEPITITGDAHLMEMAILEMVQNSKDAAVQDRPLHVSLAIEPYELEGDNCVRITYRDNGRGIPPQYSKTIYDELFSFRPGENNSGAGIGLSFVRRVFEAHGGFIYTGMATQGAEFVGAIRYQNTPVKMKEETNVSHSYS